MIKDEKFNEFYNMFSSKLYTFIYYRTNDELIAEELMQETFFTLLQLDMDLDSKNNDELRRITYKIAKNKIMNWNKNNKRRLEIFEENISQLSETDISYDPEEILENADISEKVRDVLRKITKEQRDAIALVKLRGCSYKMAGKILKKKEDDIKQLVHRGKESFKRILRKEYPEIAERHEKTKKILSIITIILATTMITGIVYASIKVYEHLNKANTFTLEQVEAQRDESKVNIKREEAENIMKEYLSALGIKEDNFEELKLTSNGIRDKEIWSLYKDDKYKINISSDTGELVKFNFVLDNNKNIDNKSNTNTNTKLYVKNVIDKLNFGNRYNKLEYKNKSLEDEKILDFYYYNDKDDYHTRRINIRYYKNRIISIINYNYIINNNLNIKIKEKEAIETLKKKYKVKTIESIELVESVSREDKVEEEYELENNVDDNFLMYNHNTTKYVWEITYNGDRKQSIDCETGEILENEQSYEKKKD